MISHCTPCWMKANRKVPGQMTDKICQWGRTEASVRDYYAKNEGKILEATDVRLN